MEERAQGHHQHEAVVHEHKHFHVTHYLHKGENWGHLLSTHEHDHNLSGRGPRPHAPPGRGE